MQVTPVTKDPEQRTLSINYLLGKTVSHVGPSTVSRFATIDLRYSHHFPLFTMSTIRTMLLDPRIKFALNLIKGPVATYTKFYSEEEANDPGIQKSIIELNYYFPYKVVSDNPQLSEFVLRQLNRFWETGIYKYLNHIQWGWSGNEVLYKRTSKGIEYANLYPFSSDELECAAHKGKILGFRRTTTNTGYIPIGKGLWGIHEREENPYYGRSRLLGAHVPWHETWSLGGARDIRRQWFFKNAFDGGEIYYPQGTWTDENGMKHPNEELAVRMAENKRSGSTAIFPSEKALDGKRQWEYMPAKANMTPQGLPEYVDDLKDEELEGMGIPPEVVKSSGSQGMGAATGRMVPLMAFISSLSPIVTDAINDFCTQVVNMILLPANGMKGDYEVKRITPKTEDQVTPVQEKTIADSGID